MALKLVLRKFPRIFILRQKHPFYAVSFNSPPGCSRYLCPQNHLSQHPNSVRHRLPLKACPLRKLAVIPGGLVLQEGHGLSLGQCHQGGSLFLSGGCVAPGGPSWAEEGVWVSRGNGSPTSAHRCLKHAALGGPSSRATSSAPAQGRPWPPGTGTPWLGSPGRSSD